MDSLRRSHVCAVHILFKDLPVVRKPDLLAAMQEEFGQVVSPESKEGESEPLTVFFPEHVSTFKEGSVPMSITFIPMPDIPTLDDSVHAQSHDFTASRMVLEGCKAAISVADIMTVGVDRQVCLDVFQRAILTLIDLVGGEAIFWHSSQRLVSVGSYIESKRGQQPDPLYPVVNVRLFRVEDRAEGELVMDTCGLHIFGLPDIQCHFVDLDPNQVGNLLYSYATYIFEQGDVIADGHTVHGIPPEKKWAAQHEVALVAPEREVLDIRPHAPHAAGHYKSD